MVNGGTLSVGGDTSMIDTLTANDGTLAVSGDTLTVSGGTLMVSNDTSTIDGYTLTSVGGDIASRPTLT
jgi:formylmethanofuran dehydrogenase subunit C